MTTQSTMSLFVPAVAIIAFAVVILVFAGVLGIFDGMHESRTMAAFHRAMAASVRPRPCPAVVVEEHPPALVLPDELAQLVAPRADRVPILPAAPPSGMQVPFVVPVRPPNPPRRLRTPPPIPPRLSRLSVRNDTDPDELSAITSRYTSEQFASLQRQSK